MKSGNPKLPARIPVIDLFAGPGGLSEGFSCLENADGRRGFDVRLSIEKDPVAHRTLELRSLFRSFEGKPPDAYYDYLRGNISRSELFALPAISGNIELAKNEAWNKTLAPDSHREVSNRVKAALCDADPWILIGGPPCQAYSLVGRSRMRAEGLAKFEKDHRHFLYREYLRIIAAHSPSVFIMENVKGLLSATHGGSRMFERIIADLKRPEGCDHSYRIVPLGATESLFDPAPSDFVLKSERYGVPQARHRVILCGIRDDIRANPRPIDFEPEVTVSEAFWNLPPLRGRISKEPDSHSSWLQVLAEARKEFFRRNRTRAFAGIRDEMDDAINRALSIEASGAEFTAVERRGDHDSSMANQSFRAWFHDPNLPGVTGHATRSHMRADLKRYFFASSYARLHGISPKIRDFPDDLLPNHRNAAPGSEYVPFGDRFRVQVADRPSTTIVSHISKDGHYFIHPDPAQCRSLTVREAARLQTFPDNYHFEGNRTQQYVQVGNAVPPLLAAKIAKSIYMLLTYGR